MSGKWHNERCPVCGEGTLHDGERIEVTEYRGRKFTARQQGAFCDKCDDGMAYHDAASADAWNDFRKGVHEDERKELAAARQTLGLTQHDAAKISGGGHNAFSRYERGDANPVLGVVNLFRLLARYPQLLMDLGVTPKQSVWTTSAITTPCMDVFNANNCFISIGGTRETAVFGIPILSYGSPYPIAAHWAAAYQGNECSEDADCVDDDDGFDPMASTCRQLVMFKGNCHGSS